MSHPIKGATFKGLGSRSRTEWERFDQFSVCCVSCMFGAGV